MMADKIADMQQNITTDLRLDSDLRPDFEKVHKFIACGSSGYQHERSAHGSLYE